MDSLDLLRHDVVSRRAFLARMGALGLGVASAQLLAGCGGGGGGNGNSSGGGNQPGAVPNVYPASFGAGVIAVLNFAQSYETMEASLYTQALNKASGRDINAPRVPVAQANATYRLTVPGNISAPAQGFTFLKQLAYIEAGHSEFIRMAIQALGGTPVPPNPGGYRFPDGLGNNLRSILESVLPVQETSNRAVLGSSPDLAGNLLLLQTAGTIYSVECRYSAGLRFAMNVGGEVGPVRMSGDREVVSRPPSEQTFEKFKAAQEVLAFAQRYFA